MSIRWIVVVGIIAISMPQWGHAQERFALTTHQVAQTLADRGIQVGETQVSMVANVVATEPSPKLDILSVQQFPAPYAEHTEARSWVKLVCHLPGRCLPFYVIVSTPQGQIERSPEESPAAYSKGNILFEPKSEIAMQAGTHATLILDDHRSQIQVAVVSLQKGTAGQRIRVASPDHKHVYMAEVVSASLLKGSF
jgi:hypothetical protein